MMPLVWLLNMVTRVLMRMVGIKAMSPSAARSAKMSCAPS
jgi:Mg2+/Co2+ transporter CorB